MRAQLEAQLLDINRNADITSHFQPLQDKIDLVVVTDSEAILGIGDNGVGGITISTSKAALYTLGAGVNPNRILPVVLDVGTDNHALWADPLYMGWKRNRLRGKNYEWVTSRGQLTSVTLWTSSSETAETSSPTQSSTSRTLE